MKPTIIPAFAVHGDNGGGSGRGPIEGYCKSHSDAKAMAVGRGWYGGPGAITEMSAIIVGDTMYALQSSEPIEFMDAIAAREAQDEEIRKRALAKLSPEEQRALKLA